MNIGRHALIAIATLLAFTSAASACIVEDVDLSFGSVYENVNPFEMLSPDGVVNEAYEDLGETLDEIASLFGIEDPVNATGYFHVQFVYTVLGSGGNQVPVCFEKNAGETFEEAIMRWLEENTETQIIGGWFEVDQIVLHEDRAMWLELPPSSEVCYLMEARVRPAIGGFGGTPGLSNGLPGSDPSGGSSSPPTSGGSSLPTVGDTSIDESEGELIATWIQCY